MSDKETIPGLRAFVAESNRIEGILRKPKSVEIIEHERLLHSDSVTVGTLREFVMHIAGAELRERPGMCVRVGNHVPIEGGGLVVAKLMGLLDEVYNNEITPWRAHMEYETLHPFMDGNGRSGRALWAWQILKHDLYPHGLEMGFLHPFYYATLSLGSAALRPTPEAP